MINMPHPSPRTNPDLFLSNGRLECSAFSYYLLVIACILRELYIYIGLYESYTPPEIITSASSFLIYFAASTTEDNPEAQAVLTVIVGPLVLYFTLSTPVGILVIK
jgi:hypothetical protein